MNHLKTVLLFVILLLVPLSLNVVKAHAQEDITSYYNNSDTYYPNELSRDKIVSDTATAMGVLFTSTLVSIYILLGLGTYIYSSIALMITAKRLNAQNEWFAWVPILNLVLLFQLGEKSPYLLFLLLIPGIGALAVFIITIMASMRISERRGYDSTLGLLSLIPVTQYILLGIWAWGKKE
jgi:hypothetical protein